MTPCFKGLCAEILRGPVSSWPGLHGDPVNSSKGSQIHCELRERALLERSCAFLDRALVHS